MVRMYVCVCVCVCVFVCVCVSTFSNIFSSETTGPIKANFMWSLLGKGERKVIQMVEVT